MPRTVFRPTEPQLATLVDEAPSGDGWLHEMKLDGYRILARREDGDTRLFTRNGNDWTAKMRSLAGEELAERAGFEPAEGY